MKRNNDSYWLKLDNVGTLYASLSTKYNPDNYRLSVKLKEKVNKKILEAALLDTLEAMPSFNVKLRKGFFWYYLEQNYATPIVEEDKHFAYMAINDYNNNYFLFKVTYYEKRINIDFSHILTDGTGSLNFLSTLVTNYMKIKHPKKVKQSVIAGPELVSLPEMGVDSFSKYASEPYDKTKVIKEDGRKTYLLTGPKVGKNKSNVIIGTVSVKQLKELAKQKDVTITTYLTAALFYAIYHGNLKYTKSKDPIIICIPVDLRHFFPSDSMNNFFTTITISINAATNDYSFDDILKIVSDRLAKELDKSVLVNKFRFFARLQQNIILRFIPLVVKDFLLRGITSVMAGRGATTVISNLGIVKISDEVKEFVDKFDIIAYPYDLMPIRVAVCSFEDNLSITFSTSFVNAEIERIFFTYLSSHGIDVNISTSLKDDDGGVSK